MFFPVKGPYKITQRFKGLSHDGLDIVSFYDSYIYSSVDGIVERSGWENPKNKSQGFGLYVRIRDKNNRVFYFGHLSKTLVSVGSVVRQGDKIGIIGNTGYSTGTHLHYCCRDDGLKSFPINVALQHSIKNLEGLYNPFIVKRSWRAPIIVYTPYITQAKKVAKENKAVVYDYNGKTLYSYR